MELSLLPFGRQQRLLSSHLNALHHPSLSPSSARRLLKKSKLVSLPCRCSKDPSASLADLSSVFSEVLPADGRRWFLGFLLASAAGLHVCDKSDAVSTSRRALRAAKIPESDFTTLPNGLKYYDLKVGGGPKAVKGSRVAVHYVAKWKGVTFMTSRQGLGVGGGTPYGFDVGQSEKGSVLKGLDLGVQGMRVGGQRLLIVPPDLAYGSKGVQEIPPNATIELDVELLAIKQSPFGSGVKLIEG
ncbi:peptidyl-prolyl cis-trans isomerase FKBP16-4, chloroplastic isoform X2 [Elaeis guineensis]|uniref:peptidylprolyl isomerase n=1 Tax=Elaeis guineensis var. tenera TaxID=51953 RepID=A0A8N4IGE5_ELAGV|nr:peptidyl-prolyl cis-trans isomerase FKBP16-4, chloroplastic [Elaeis guineensis]XP_029123392.1 peptidyl-prolyl cis-trans isomerase FKBP16-4, chloroplastic [Elaeis guineensis]